MTNYLFQCLQRQSYSVAGLLRSLVFIGLLSSISLSSSLSAQSGEPTASPTKRDTAQVNSWLTQGQAIRIQNPKEAGRYAKLALDLSKDLGYKAGQVKALILSSYPLLVGGQFEAAEALSTEARALAKEENLKSDLAIAANNLSICYMNTGRTEASFEALIEAAENFRLAGRLDMQAKVLGNLGSSLMIVGQDARAQPYLVEAERISLIQKDTLSASHFLLNLALAKKHLGDTLLAQQDILKVYDHAKHFQSPELIYAGAINLADIALAQGKVEQTLNYWQEALSMATAMKSPDKTALPLYGLANYHFKRGDNQKAKKLLLESIALSEQAGEKVRLKDAYNLMATILKQEGRYAEALPYLEKFISLDHLVRSAEVQKNINLIETRYETEKKERQIIEQRLTLSEKQKTIERNSLLFGLILLFLLMLILIAYIRRVRLKQAQVITQKTLESLQNKQEALRLEAILQGEEQERRRVSQELHDGLGGLLAATKYKLSALSKTTSELQGAIDLLDSAALEARNISHRLSPEWLIQKGLSEALSSYCKTLDDSGKLSVQCEIFQAPDYIADEKSELTLFRIAQELISNVLKHAAASQLLVQLNQNREAYLLTIEDNGKGFDWALISEQNGIGLLNLRRRIENFNGHIQWHSAANEGTSVEVMLPIIQF